MHSGQNQAKKKYSHTPHIIKAGMASIHQMLKKTDERPLQPLLSAGNKRRNWTLGKMLLLVLAYRGSDFNHMTRAKKGPSGFNSRSIIL